MRWILILALLAACSDPPAKKTEAKPDDGCAGYLIKPDGSKECLRK